MLEIRRARPEDADDLVRLAHVLGYAIDVVTVRATVERSDQSDAAVLVATAGGLIVGWAHVYRTDLVQTMPFAELGGLVVDPKRRGSGVGNRLVEAAEQWAFDHGLAVMRVRSNVVRSGAHRFYERNGYAVEKTSLTFVKPIPPR
jgi:GNAT superfamily N-acetyltransferase